MFHRIFCTVLRTKNFSKVITLEQKILLEEEDERMKYVESSRERKYKEKALATSALDALHL